MPAYAGPNAPYTLPNTRVDGTASPTNHATDHNQEANAINDLLAAMGTVIADGAQAFHPWQFTPETYGAKGDGKIVGDVSCNATQTFTSPNMVAAGVAIGQWVMIDGGRGTSDTAAIGVVTGVAGNNVTISAPTLFGGSALPINATASSLHALWGTNDQAAIVSAITAASTYAQAHAYYGEVIFDDKTYVVASAPTQSSGSPAFYNSQLEIPYPTANGRKLIMAFTGVNNNAALQFWGANTPQLTGTVVCSMQTAPGTIDATFGPQSVFGGPTGNAGFTSGGANPNWPNIKAVFRGIEVMMPVYTHLTAFDLTWLGGCTVDGCSAQGFANPLNGNGVLLGSVYTDGAVFGSRQGVGLRCPQQGNNADVWIPDFAAEGLFLGLEACEHVRVGNYKSIYTALGIRLIGTQAHGLDILGWTAEAFQTGIQAHDNGPYPVNINMVTEGSPLGYDIDDQNNALRGIIRWMDAEASPRQPVVRLAGKVKIVNETNGPGHVASPTVPATTVALLNPFWRDAAVNVTGGTVTVIAVDGTATGLTSGTVIVPSNKTVTLTYTVAPSWNWTLL